MENGKCKIMKKELLILMMAMGCCLMEKMWAGGVKVPSIYIPNDTSSSKTYSPKQTFRWERIDGVTTYIIEIDTVATFTSEAKTQYTRTISASNKDAYVEKEYGNLYLGCFNYWHVKAVSKNDTSDWSKTHLFHTVSKAVALSPNGKTDVAIPVTLTWKYQYGTTNTIIEIDTTASFATAKVIDREVPNETWAYQQQSNLLNSTTYYWRVKNYHLKDTTEWSEVMRFTTWAGEVTRLDENENGNVNGNRARKVMKEGRMYIVMGEGRFDVLGRRSEE